MSGNMQSMEQILGQRRAIEPLQAALASGRLHHAYIFHGPAGVGKFTTARVLAEHLLCHEPARTLTGALEPCGGCPACKAFMHDGHPDLHVVTKELARFSDDSKIRNQKLMNIPRDVLNERLVGPVTRMPRLGDRKVFIVDEAELIDAIGQNLLLKTLEEPPVGTFIILITSAEDRLLPTIRSRCQRVAFTPLPDAAVEDWIGKQDDAPDGDTRAWVVRFAAGSLGMAELAIAHDLAAWGAVIEPAMDRIAGGQYPTDLGADLKDLIDGFAAQWVDTHDNASKEAANKRAAAIAWRIISQDAQRRIAADAETCDPAEPADAEAKLSPWLAMLDALHTAEGELASNVNMGLVTDHLVSMLVRAARGERVYATS